jgi:hypothetical protein
MYGLLFTIRSLAGVCSGGKIKVPVDNQSMLIVIRVGSKTSPTLNSIAKRALTLDAAIGASLTVVWVPKTHNTYANDISKLEHKDDRQLVPSVFDMLNLRWGLHSCDRLASDHIH